MKKIMNFSMAALVAMGAILAGCAKSEIAEPEPEIEQEQEQEPELKDNIVTVTTTIGLGENDATKALSIDYDAKTLTKTFAVGETMAIVYTNTSGDSVTAVSAALKDADLAEGNKSATFTFELADPDKTKDVTYIYPASMASDDGKVNYGALNMQDGTLATLSSNLDLATYSAAWDGTSLPSGTLANQLAICAYTLKNSDGSSEITGSITSLTVSDGTNTYTVARSATAGPIYVAIRPTSGAIIHYTASDGSTNYSKSVSGKTYAAGQIYPLGLRMNNSTPLTVEALTAGTVKINIGEGIGTLSTGMKYSVNGGAKTLITTSTDIAVSAGDKVQLYGNGTATQVYGNDPKVMIQSSGEGFTCKAYGNIMSLLDEENFATKTDLPNKQSIFHDLFFTNRALTDAGDLLLPATTLAMNCYERMFGVCTSLTKAPALPATTLAYNCYKEMFNGCTALTAAPALPAEEVKYYCYSGMFYGCTSLTAAPVLPATTLVMNCYYEMFRSCTNLSSVTCLATSGINEASSTSNWLNGVAASGSFAADTDAIWPENSANGIPSGWTRRNPDGSAIGHALASAVVGEIIGSDGKAYAVTDKDFLASSVSAVGVVAYVGDVGSVETGSTYRGLAVAMSDANNGSYCMWHTADNGTCVSQTKNTDTALSYLNGIACTETLVGSNGSGVTTNCSGHTHAAAIAARSNNGTSAPTGCSDWFLPSVGQWKLIIRGLTGNSSANTAKSSDLNPKITAAGGTGLIDTGYWSSTEYNYQKAWYMDFANSETNSGYKTFSGWRKVRSVLAF